MTDKIHAVYELQGETLRSAKRLYNLLHHWGNAHPVDWQGKNLLEITRLQDENFTRFTALIAEKVPQLVQDLGLTHTAVQIKGFTGGLPRAYTERPTCHIAPHDQQKIYIYAPIDYKGQHFIPTDARLLDETEEQRVGQSLWAGGWSDPITLVPAKRSGTALPADFDPAQHQTLTPHHLGDNPAKPYRFFKAGGETLAILNGQGQDKDEYSKKTDQLFRAVTGLKNKLVKAGAISGVQSPKDVYFNFALHTEDNGRPKLEISARRDGTGEPFTLIDNAWFISTGKISGGDFVTPNPATPEGQALQKFFDAVPENPDQSGFPKALLSTDPVTPADQYDGMVGPLEKPLIRHYPDGIYLAYRTPADGIGTFTPPGATEISKAEFLWLEADEGDKNTGITLPPKPDLPQLQNHSQLKGPRHEP